MASISPVNWDDIIGYLRVNHPDLARGWFVQLLPESLEGGILHVRASNAAQVRYLEQHCDRAFAEAAQAALGRLVSVSFRSDPSTAEPVLGYEWEPQPLKLNDDFTFDNFITGPCNRLAHAAATAVATAPGRAYNPLFLHGQTGLGKTHLLQAICHLRTGQGETVRVIYISCETFTNQFLEAVQQGVMHQFRYLYRHADFLVIDDIQFLAERERSQEEFFHTFNTLHQEQRQIVLSADCPPSQIPSLEERLVSRFNSGLVTALERPCLETRMAIVRNKARLRCIQLPEDVIQLIATRVDSNIRELEGALLKIDALSQTRNGRVDLDFAYEALTGRNHLPITIDLLLEVVGRRFAVKRSDLLSEKRKKAVAQPRQIGMYLARRLTPLSLQEIGGHFGGRDHTTVLHAHRRIESLRAEDAQLNTVLEDLEAELRGRRRDQN